MTPTYTIGDTYKYNLIFGGGGREVKAGRQGWWVENLYPRIDSGVFNIPQCLVNRELLPTVLFFVCAEQMVFEAFHHFGSDVFPDQYHVHCVARVTIMGLQQSKCGTIYFAVICQSAKPLLPQLFGQQIAHNDDSWWQSCCVIT